MKIKKVLWSKKYFANTQDKDCKEFLACIEDLLKTKEIIELDNFVQHMNTSRLQHSINVAYYSFLWAKKLGLDYRSVARAGLLHDLYLYDWKENKTDEHHAFRHPKEALKNASSITTLSPIEEDAILNHMWPLSENKPKYKESRILSHVDKYCAVIEVVDQLYNKSSNLKANITAVNSKAKAKVYSQNTN
ncbi:MAG: HD domain-containing protein [bacterium]